MTALSLEARREAQAAANARLGTAFFLLVEAVLFIGLAAAALNIRGRFATWPPPGTAAPESLFLIANALLLGLSGLAAAWAWRAVRRDRTTAGWRWLALATALGGVFLAGQWLELSRLAAGAGSGTMLGDLFITLSWLHGLHVAAGLGLMGLIASLTRQGWYGRRRQVLFRAGVLYWALVVLTWPVLLAVLIIPA